MQRVYLERANAVADVFARERLRMLTVAEDEQLGNGEDEGDDPGGCHQETHSTPAPRVHPQRMADRQVAVYGRRYQDVGRGEHRNQLDVGDELAEELATVEVERHLPG